MDNDETVLCDECGEPCNSGDAVATDVGLAFCGNYYGNGCADRLDNN